MLGKPLSKCPKCGKILIRSSLERNKYICHNCNEVYKEVNRWEQLEKSQ